MREVTAMPLVSDLLYVREVTAMPLVSDCHVREVTAMPLVSDLVCERGYCHASCQ